MDDFPAIAAAFQQQGFGTFAVDRLFSEGTVQSCQGAHDCRVSVVKNGL